MEKLNKLDLMMVEEVTSHVLREMEEDEKKGEKIDRQKEFDLRTLRRKIALMRMQERENKKRYCRDVLTKLAAGTEEGRKRNDCNVSRVLGRMWRTVRGEREVRKI